MRWSKMGRVLLDEKIVGTTKISAKAPPVTPPVSPPVTPPTTVGFLERHKKIKKVVDKEGKLYRCPSVNDIATEVGLSVEDTKLHLDVMETDEAIKPVQKGDNPPICSIDAMQRLVDSLRKLRV